MFYDNTSNDYFDPRQWIFGMGRHHGGRGFGRFAEFMRGAGRGGVGRGRKFAAADLQLIILALLAEKPRHGYELLKTLEELSGGFYSPSPGTIYPALTYLEEIGHVTVEEQGNRKLHSISEAGRRHLEEHRSLVDETLEQLKNIGARMEDVRRVFTGEDQQEEGEDFGRGGSREFHAARHALRTALRQKHGCSPQEAKRIAEILRRAAAEILGKS
jgi:DNA-binding PadR family transcriptional regulator